MDHPFPVRGLQALGQLDAEVERLRLGQCLRLPLTLLLLLLLLLALVT